MLATKIVCTIGPASQSPEMLAQLIKAGMNVARINMSHGTHETHAETIRRIRAVASELGAAIAILERWEGGWVRPYVSGYLTTTRWAMNATKVMPSPNTKSTMPITFLALCGGPISGRRMPPCSSTVTNRSLVAPL